MATNVALHCDVATKALIGGEAQNVTHQVPGTDVAISSELVPGQLHVIVRRNRR